MRNEAKKAIIGKTFENLTFHERNTSAKKWQEQERKSFEPPQ
jgi:hypothetical protein